MNFLLPKVNWTEKNPDSAKEKKKKRREGDSGNLLREQDFSIPLEAWHFAQLYAINISLVNETGTGLGIGKYRGSSFQNHWSPNLLKFT